MFGYISSLALISLELICCKCFFEIFFEAEQGNRKYISLLLLFFCCMWPCAFSKYLASHMIQKQIFVLFSVTLSMHFYFRTDIKRILVFSVLWQSFLLAIDYSMYAIYIAVFPNDTVEKKYELEVVLLTLFGKMLFLLFIFFIRKKIWEGREDAIPETGWVRFLFFPIFTIIVNIAMFSNFRTVEESNQVVTLFIIAFGLVVMNIIVFYMINDIVKKEAILRQKNAFEIQGKSQWEMYQSLSENYKKQREKSHEYINKITCIRHLLKNKDYTELEEYVEEISGKLNEEHDFINTNHAIINAIINNKYQEAVKKKIVFVFKINDLSDIKISDDDIVIILSNLLNNAIEACEKCREKRVIKLKAVKEENELVISVRNTYQQPVVFRNNEFITTKKINSIEHGIGIRNVIHAVEKNNGFYSIDYKNDEFYFAIVIPEKQ